MARKSVKSTEAPQFDYKAFLTETMDSVTTRLNFDSDPIESATPMSTGMLVLDLLYGGGIRAGWYTNFGKEQSSKTTGALVIAANAVKAGVPIISYSDFEGCVTSDTYISVNGGQQVMLKDLFDLRYARNWVPNTLVNQFADVDTIDTANNGYRTAKAQLFYKGCYPVTRVSLNTGHSLDCYNHKFFVFQKNRLSIKHDYELEIGDLVLVRKDYFEPEEEEWRPVLGEGAYARKKYQVSNYGRVRSVGDVIIRALPNGELGEYHLSPYYPKPRQLKDGHLCVNLCVGDGEVKQRLVHRLVARAFIGKPTKSKPLVLHYNDDPTDNRVSNLRYGNDIDNSRDKRVHRRAPHSANAPKARLTKRTVLKARRLYKTGRYTKQYLRDKYGVTNSTLIGEGWKYLDEEQSAIPFNFDRVKDNYELAYVTSVEKTRSRKPVFDICLDNEEDFLPHSIITNGIVTHNSSIASMPYIRAILKTCGVDKTLGEVFGQKDQETGKWVTAPIVRFSAETIGERFFDLLSATLRALPDKKSIGGKWWLVYEDNKVNKAKLAEYSDPSMAKRYGNGIWIPAPNAELQAIFIVDSYPAMNPSANDEDETNNSIALQARMFSKQLPRVKGYLAKKMVAVIGTNQLRANPLDRYHPEVEPCGESLKYASDVRCKFTPRASGQPLWPKNFDKDTGWEIEKSVEAENGRDGYRYIHVKTIKNKLSTPNRIGWLRIWASDASGEGRGYDPVFDTAYYLYLTGQLVGRGRRSMKLLLNKAAVQPSITWEQIKLWVLGTTAQKKEICKSLGFTKSFALRKLCFHQLRTGVGEKLYVEHSQTAVEETED